ncbi:MAG: hypothetical protein V4722_22965 [Bacteroidota bacterium]
MLENLLGLVKEYAQENVVENPGVPDEQNDEVVAEATHAVAGGLQDALANGQGQEVMELFNSKSSAQVMSSPVAQNIQGGFLDNITSKLGINKNVAIGLASTLIPIIISKLVKRTNDPNNNSFDIGSIIGSLTGGNTGGGGIGNLISQFTGGGSGGGNGIGDLISQFTGGGNSGGNSGGNGIGDLISQFTGGAQQQQQQQGGGGLMDVIKGFMSK